MGQERGILCSLQEGKRWLAEEMGHIIEFGVNKHKLSEWTIQLVVRIQDLIGSTMNTPGGTGQLTECPHAHEGREAIFSTEASKSEMCPSGTAPGCWPFPSALLGVCC